MNQDEPLIISAVDDLDEARLQLPAFNPADILGKKFIKNVHGDPDRAEVKQQVYETRFLVSHSNGEREEIMIYNEIHDYIDRAVDEEQDDLFIFEEILDHRKGKNSKYEVLVKWETGEKTWKPLSSMAKQDPKTMAKYAEMQGLLDLPQWRRLKTHSRKNKIQYMRAVAALAGIKTTAAKFKFDVQIPNCFSHCIKLD